MNNVWRTLLLCLAFAITAFADSEDNAVFRTRMLPDSEVPPVSAAGNSAAATVTIHVTRDGRGNLSAATVILDVDYTVNTNVTFTGLRIQNAPAGQNGAVAIDTSLSSSSPV